jgi:ribosome-associated protein
MAKTEAKGKPAGTVRLPKQVDLAIAAALDKKASDVLVLDLRKAGGFTDFFIICSAQNARQIKAIADAVEERLAAERVKPSHVEGYDRAEWVLIDYFDFIVHVFTPDMRAFYGLERLWGTATRIPVADAGAASGGRHPTH